jgi:hypothetical protein
MVSHLKQKTLVACPVAQARSRIAEFIKQNGTDGGTSLHIPLGFHLGEREGAVAMALERPVVLDLTLTTRPSDLEPRFEVSWQPGDGGPYPTFSGALEIENEDYDSFWLVLEGTYEPPFGLLGSAFDAIVGKRIAAQSGRELLARIASFIEAGFQAAEAEKPASPPQAAPSVAT